VVIAAPVAMLSGLRKRGRTVRTGAFGRADPARLALVEARLLGDVLPVANLAPGNPVADPVVLLEHRAAALVDIGLGGVGVARPVADTLAKGIAPRLHLRRRLGLALASGLYPGLAGIRRIAAAVEDGTIAAAVDTLDIVDALHTLHSIDALLAHLLAGFGALLACLRAVFARLRSLGLAILSLARTVAVVALREGGGESCSCEQQAEDEITHTDLWNLASHLKDFCASTD
jgi:hypothetical protein